MIFSNENYLEESSETKKVAEVSTAGAKHNNGPKNESADSTTALGDVTAELGTFGIFEIFQ